MSSRPTKPNSSQCCRDSNPSTAAMLNRLAALSPSRLYLPSMWFTFVYTYTFILYTWRVIYIRLCRTGSSLWSSLYILSYCRCAKPTIVIIRAKPTEVIIRAKQRNCHLYSETSMCCVYTGTDVVLTYYLYVVRRKEVVLLQTCLDLSVTFYCDVFTAIIYYCDLLRCRQFIYYVVG